MVLGKLSWALGTSGQGRSVVFTSMSNKAATPWWVSGCKVGAQATTRKWSFSAPQSRLHLLSPRDTWFGSYWLHCRSRQTIILHIAATSSSCYIFPLVASSPSWCRQSLWNCGRCRSVRTRDSEVVSCDWKKKSKIKLQFSPAPVLPVVIFVVEGASFEYLKVSRPKNGIVDNRSVLEPRRLREALVVRVWFLLVAGGVPILLRELLTAGLVLKIQLYCLVTTFWVPFIWQPSPTNLDKAQGQFSCPFINSLSDKSRWKNFLWKLAFKSLLDWTQ